MFSRHFPGIYSGNTEDVLEYVRGPLSGRRAVDADLIGFAIAETGMTEPLAFLLNVGYVHDIGVLLRTTYVDNCSRAGVIARFEKALFILENFPVSVTREDYRTLLGDHSWQSLYTSHTCLVQRTINAMHDSCPSEFATEWARCAWSTTAENIQVFNTIICSSFRVFCAAMKLNGRYKIDPRLIREVLMAGFKSRAPHESQEPTRYCRKDPGFYFLYWNISRSRVGEPSDPRDPGRPWLPSELVRLVFDALYLHGD